MTTINSEGCYCCLCFVELTEDNITVINGQKFDTCIPCETEERRRLQPYLNRLRNHIHELELTNAELKKDMTTKNFSIQLLIEILADETFKLTKQDLNKLYGLIRCRELKL